MPLPSEDTTPPVTNTCLAMLTPTAQWWDRRAHGVPGPRPPSLAAHRAPCLATPGHEPWPRRRRDCRPSCDTVLPPPRRPRAARDRVTALPAALALVDERSGGSAERRHLGQMRDHHHLGTARPARAACSRHGHSRPASDARVDLVEHQRLVAPQRPASAHLSPRARATARRRTPSGQAPRWLPGIGGQQELHRIGAGLAQSLPPRARIHVDCHRRPTPCPVRRAAPPMAASSSGAASRRASVSASASSSARASRGAALRPPAARGPPLPVRATPAASVPIRDSATAASVDPPYLRARSVYRRSRSSTVASRDGSTVTRST